jgi:outer membrane protein insertion porin family
VKEKGRIALKTGTDLGNTEGSAYGNLLVRNIFGGAESLNVNASAGTRTRSSYTATFDTPILSNPDFRFTLDGFVSSTQKPWASHEEVLKGGKASLKWADKDPRSRHEVTYTQSWRQLTALAENASPTVRHDAGDSVKSSVSHIWWKDARNHPFLPTSGYFMRTVSEVAGWGALKGDVAFWKSEMETTTATSLSDDHGVSLQAGARLGVLYPLPLGWTGKPQASRLNDRFQLGGPTDVRGFSIGGLGPRDGVDAVGGDVFAAGSVNLLFPFPRVGKDTPLRFQVFANGGRSLALSRDSDSTSKNVWSTIGKLGNGLPSLAAGVGVVYAHPVARFELNFSLPLVMRRGEEGRKGLQFGVGINFL